MNVSELVAKLQAASIAYHSGATPIMSDAEYDSLEAQLRKLDPKHPFLSKVGAQPTPSKWEKVTHEYPMLSLNKAQTEDEMRTWKGRFRNQECLIMWKFDGLACNLSYFNGNLVQASTRGSGTEGENITKNAKQMRGVIETIPISPGLENLHIRGEIVCTRSALAANWPEALNARNITSGTAKRFDGTGCEHLDVIVYDVKGGNFATREASLAYLSSVGFNVAGFELVSTPEEIQKVYESQTLAREAQDFDTDGLVITLNDLAKFEDAGELNGRPLGSIAYKFPHAECETTLEDIVWSVGSGNRITPVSSFSSVLLSGAMVSRATLHNVSNINALTSGQGFRRGARIKVSRRGDVIPQIEALIDNGDGPFLDIPENCPVCQGEVGFEGEYLICKNLSCEAKTTGRIATWLNKLNILDFGPSVIEALVDSGLVTTVPDLYTLTVPQLANLKLSGRTLGASMAKTLIDNLHAKKELTIAEFIGSLNIPLFGRSMCQILVDQGVRTLSQFQALTVANMSKYSQIGSAKSEALVRGLAENKELIEKLLSIGVSIKMDKAPVVGDLNGKVFVFTGFRDKELTATLEARGAVVKDSYTKDVTHLVCKDLNSTSSKVDKARKNGATILDINGVLALL